MVKKSLLSIICFGLFLCSVSYSMDYGPEGQKSSKVPGKLVDHILGMIVKELLSNKSAQHFPKNAKFDFLRDCTNLPFPLPSKLVCMILDKSPGLKSRIFQKCSVPCKLFQHASVHLASFNKAGDKVVSASSDGFIRIWDVQTGECKVLEGHTGWVFSAVFNEAGDEILSASEDGTVRIWDVQTGECKVITVYPGWFWLASFNKEGDKVVPASWYKTLRVRDVQPDGSKILQGHTDEVNSAVFNKERDKIVSASRDGTVRIWDVYTGKCVNVLEGHADWVNSAVFNKSGDKIVSASLDDTVRIWDLKYFLLCCDYLTNELTLEQALLLACWNDATENGQRFNIADYSHLVPVLNSIENNIVRNIIQPQDANQLQDANQPQSLMSRTWSYVSNSRAARIALVTLPVMAAAVWGICKYLKRK